MFVVLTVGDADITAPGDEWRRGREVTSFPGRSNGP
jgi:hypothetical protein